DEHPADGQPELHILAHNWDSFPAGCRTIETLVWPRSPVSRRHANTTGGQTVREAGSSSRVTLESEPMHPIREMPPAGSPDLFQLHTRDSCPTGVALVASALS